MGAPLSIRFDEALLVKLRRHADSPPEQRHPGSPAEAEAAWLTEQRLLA